MADAVGFEGANFVFQAPKDMKNCKDLECFANGNVIISCWRLTPEEMNEINKTGVIWLSMNAQRPPPVYVSGKALVSIGDRPSKAEPVLPKRKR